MAGKKSQEGVSKPPLDTAAILESISDGVNVFDREWRYVYVNAAGARMVKKRPEELLGKNVWELWPAAADSPFGAAYRKAMTENVFVKVEAFYPEPLNTWYEVRCYPSPAGLSLLFTDITERKRAEKELRDTKVFNETTLNALRDVFFTFTPEGRLLSWNAAVRRVTGFSDEDIAAMTPLDFIAPEDRPRTSEAIAKVFREGFASVTVGYLTKDGRRIPYEFTGSVWKDSEGEVMGCAGTGRDLSERIETQKTLSRLAAIVNQSEDAILSTDLQGAITSWNPSAQRLFGYTHEEALGRSITLLAPEGLQSQMLGNIEKIVLGKSVYYESQRRAKDGALIDVWAVISPIKDAEGRVIGVSGVYRDITERKRMDRELSFKNTLLQSQQEASLDGILVVDANARVVSFNQHFVELWRIPPELVAAGVDAPVLRHNTGLVKDPESFLRRVEYLFAHRTERSEDEIELKDGRILARNSVPITEPDGGYLGRVWFFRDITQRKRAEAGLQAQKRLLSLATNLAHLGPWEFDGRNGLFVFNEEFYAIYGTDVRREGMTMAPEAYIQEFVHPDDRDLVEQVIAKAMASTDPETTVNMRHRIIRRDGAVRTLAVLGKIIRDPAGTVVAWYGANQDVTEHQQTDQALREYADEVSDLYNRAPCGYHSLGPDGTVIRMNDTELAWLGYTREEVVGKKDFRELLAPEAREAFEQGFAILKSGGSRKDVEGELRRKDGTTLAVLINTTAIRDTAGNFLASRTTVVDLTGLKRIQQEKARIEAQYLQAQKMEAVGKLAGGVAHDFNNLLTGIRGFTEFLSQQVQDKPQASADVAEILKATDRAAALTRQLLAFSRKQALSPTLLDLNETVSGMASMLRRLIGENIELATSLGGALERVRADQGQMEQALMNLTVNARDAMPAGGRISIATANVTLGEEQLREHLELEPGPYVALTVGDSGTGIPPEVLPRIFEPFFTTKGKGKGTGLGLSMVYGFVKQSGGDISVQSAVGQGTQVTIYLPAVGAGPAARASAPAAAPAASGSETILLVEDDDTVRRLTARGLRTAGYEIIEAASGSQALQLAREREGRLQLLLTDVVMPGMSGAELARRLIAQAPGLKVLFISGYTDDSLGQHGILEPGTQLLLKPFTQEALTAKVRAVLDSDRGR